MSYGRAAEQQPLSVPGPRSPVSAISSFGSMHVRMIPLVPSVEIELEPKAMLAQLALEEAQIAKDPLRNGKYDAYDLPSFADPTIGDFMASRAYRGKPGARRAKARDMGLM